MEKRGRKKAEVAVGSESVVAPEKVRRGRKPKAVVGYDSTLPCSSDDEHIIMKLNIAIANDNGCEGNVPCPFNENESGPYSDICYENEMNTLDTVLPSCGDTNPDTLKICELLKDFEQKNKNNEWPQTTNIHCYWCCHRFETPPFGIPLKYTNSKFHVYGCFCSLECAASYNFDSKESHDEIWERYNLINLIAKKIGHGHTVKASPTRLALTMFGGYLNIEAFRAYCKTSKIININFPPMMTLTQQIEEINECDIMNDHKYIPVDTDRINKYKERLSLKRSKPVNALENTLDHTMNLKFGMH